jgi:DNA-binding NtrC family response regulator
VARIVAVTGPRRGVAFEIGARAVVGRSSEVEIQLIDDKVSREHCSIEILGTAQAALLDLGSRNGTWLNARRINDREKLNPGDKISVGESVLVFEPDFDAIATRDGESTLLLSSAPPVEPRSSNAAPSGSALEAAGALALRASSAADADAARSLLIEAARVALDASGVVVFATRGSAIKPMTCWPAGATFSIGRGLIDLALDQGRAVTQKQAQARAESDPERTLLRSDASNVLCSAAFFRGSAVGALAVIRNREFSSEDLALATGLASAVGPALAERERESEEPLPPIAVSAPMRHAVELASMAANARTTVLLTGETGTGKEELALLIHRKSARRSGPFVAINSGAIPTELAESELFGHAKGAFSGAVDSHIGAFERAHGGTLLLDEVGELSPPLQVKLLRALEERVIHRVGGKSPVGIDVRVIAATHRDLEAMVKSGQFRDDLYWRLNVLQVRLAPLRERPEDVVPLAERFLQRFAVELGRKPLGFSGEAEQALLRAVWPGNIRELKNAIERAVVLQREPGPIAVSDLPIEVVSPQEGSAGTTLAERIRALEKEQIALALLRAGGKKVAAAEALGISRPTLDRKIEEYGLIVPSLGEP